MTQHHVVIAGGGPTGLVLAAELQLAGVDVAIVERRATQTLAGSRAGGLHARTIEIFDQRGIAQRFLAEGTTMQATSFATIPLDLRDAPTRHNYTLALWQNHIERILAAWVEELGVRSYRDRSVLGFVQDDAGVDVQLSDGNPLRATYLVGCDGGRSLVRRTCGIDFAGHDASVSYLIAECEAAEEPALGMRHNAQGVYGIGRLEGGRVRIVLGEPEVRHGDAPSLDELRAALVALYGTDFGVHSPTWLSRFSDATRQAVAYRDRRVLLAGDAAHVHSPANGQGLNLGVHDATNLGWKLAQVVHGTSPETLLDTYHAERHPVGARVLANTMAATALGRGDVRTQVLRERMTELLALDEPRRRYGAMIAGLDVRYDLGGSHPLVGRRVPDLEVLATDGPIRVFALLHAARGVLLVLDESELAADAWGDRVTRIAARYAGAWELPVLGEVPPPGAVLVRPDGYVAWVGEGNAASNDAGLVAALTRWFGPR